MTTLELDWDLAYIDVPAEDPVALIVPIPQRGAGPHLVIKARMAEAIGAALTERFRAEGNGFVDAALIGVGSTSPAVQLRFESLERLDNWSPEETRTAVEGMVQATLDRYSADRRREQALGASWLGRAADSGTTVDPSRVRSV